MKDPRDSVVAEAALVGPRWEAVQAFGAANPVDEITVDVPGALFSTGLGWFILVILYGGIIYAGYEVAIFRAQPVPLVMGLSAVPFLGFFVPIIFLAMPTRMQAGAAAETDDPSASGSSASASESSSEDASACFLISSMSRRARRQ